jgi:predicted DNA-binding antitoxin AbrB/MazE fold protein
MSQVVTATFEDGVLKPAEPLALPENATVRLTIDAVIVELKQSPAERLAAMEVQWRNSKLRSDGERLTRDQLHERR